VQLERNDDAAGPGQAPRATGEPRPLPPPVASPEPRAPVPQGRRDTGLFAEPARPAAAPPAAPATPPPASPAAYAGSGKGVEHELFEEDSSAPRAPAPPPSRPNTGARALPVVSFGAAPAPAAERAGPPRTEAPLPFDPLEGTPPARANAVPAAPAGRPRSDTDWSSILHDMDRDENGELSREDTAEAVIRRLETSGIALANSFRPKDKRKIAGAAKKGEMPRRQATRTVARHLMDKVTYGVDNDPRFAELARDFVSLEALDALAALERTQKSNRNASPRLSAFLLLDAALGPAR